MTDGTKTSSDATSQNNPSHSQGINNNTSILPERHDSSTSTSTSTPPSNNQTDLEKAATAIDNGATPRQGTASSTTSRITRIQSLRSRRAYDNIFSHPLHHTKTTDDVIVDFDGPDDPYRPQNWPFRKKVLTTLLYGLTTMGATFASSVYSPTVPVIAEEYGVGQEVSLLGLSFLLAGFGLGPLLWGPISEIYGRKPTVLIPYFIGAMFTFGTGAGKDIQTILITRFFTGLFSSAPVTNTGGVLGDIWKAEHRGTAIVCYAFAVVGGPIFGPIVGGAFVTTGVDWRWTEYLTGIFMLTVLTFDVLILDESYPPALLVNKARRLRIQSQNWALHAKHEEWDPSFGELAVKFGVRPFQMLLTPICFLIALYASFVYGLLYGNLAAFPIVFEQERGWNPLVGSLPFLGILVGMIIGGGVNVLNQRFYISRFKANGNKPIPEARLPPQMIGSVSFAAGCFIFAWTSPRQYHWIGPIIGTVLIGLGFFTIFQSCLNYLIDTFQRYSASAVAANTFLRSVFALAFPLFIPAMYSNIGISWGTSVFGFFAAALIPIPYLFYVFGASLRKKGKYSANMG